MTVDKPWCDESWSQAENVTGAAAAKIAEEAAAAVVVAEVVIEEVIAGSSRVFDCYIWLHFSYNCFTFGLAIYDNKYNGLHYFVGVVM